MLDKSVFWFCTLAIQVGFLVKMICLLISFLRSGKWPQSLMTFCGQHLARVVQWWKYSGQRPGQREVDLVRCKWTRTFWSVVSTVAIFRVVLLQVTRYTDQEFVPHSFELIVIISATIGLVLMAFPNLINPESQDFWYVLSMLIVDITFLIPSDIDVRDVITFTFTGRFMYAVLAKRGWCVVLCLTFHLLQALQLNRAAEDTSGVGQPGWSTSTQSLVTVLMLMFVGIMAVRRLMNENVLLKLNLRKRTVEMGAVSSLLTACYDAVLEVDNDLKLTQDSCHLSSMLLCAPPVGGLSGKALLDFFSQSDRDRISQRFLAAASEKMSVMALNADMLDCDFNHVKVELFSAQFKNLADEQCFLVGLREVQDLQPCAIEPISTCLGASQLALTGNEDLVVVFDVFTFEIQIMSSDMQQLSQQHLGVKVPDKILALASSETQPLLDHQLQVLGNQFAAEKTPVANSTVTFDFLGLCQATGSVTIERDEVLDCWVGSMVIQLAGGGSSMLTQSNLQCLDKGVGQSKSSPHSLQLVTSTSQISKKSSSRSSRSRKSSASRTFDRSGAISELRGSKVPL